MDDQDYEHFMNIVETQADQLKMLTSTVESILKRVKILNDIENSRQGKIIQELIH